MGQSNRSAVEANKIDPDERLDLVVPRNGSLTIRVELTDDADEPVNLTGETIVAGVKTSYEASGQAFVPTIHDRDDAGGAFSITYPAASAKALGPGVIDCVHDCLRTPSGGGEPKRIFAGLLELSKGAA
jgi:hypothetical protein